LRPLERGCAKTATLAAIKKPVPAWAGTAALMWLAEVAESANHDRRLTGLTAWSACWLTIGTISYQSLATGAWLPGQVRPAGFAFPIHSHMRGYQIID